MNKKRQEKLLKQMKYITVLDFEVGKVFQYESLICDFEEYLSGLGHNLGNCEWMVHDSNEIITN